MLPARWLQGLGTQQVPALTPSDGTSKGIFFIFEHDQSPGGLPGDGLWLGLPVASAVMKKPLHLSSPPPPIVWAPPQQSHGLLYRVRSRKPGARQKLSVLPSQLYPQNLVRTEPLVGTKKCLCNKQANASVSWAFACTITMANVMFIMCCKNFANILSSE